MDYSPEQMELAKTIHRMTWRQKEKLVEVINDLADKEDTEEPRASSLDSTS